MPLVSHSKARSLTQTLLSTEQGRFLHWLHKSAVQARTASVGPTTKERPRVRSEEGLRSEASHLVLPTQGRVEVLAH